MQKQDKNHEGTRAHSFWTENSYIKIVNKCHVKCLTLLNIITSLRRHVTCIGTDVNLVKCRKISMSQTYGNF